MFHTETLFVGKIEVSDDECKIIYVLDHRLGKTSFRPTIGPIRG